MAHACCAPIALGSAMPIPEDTLRLLALVVDRGDFASVERDLDGRRWFVGLLNGRRGDDGERKITWYVAPRLTPALEAARAAPKSEPVQQQLRAAGGRA
jgi:hypothetical protein